MPKPNANQLFAKLQLGDNYKPPRYRGDDGLYSIARFDSRHLVAGDLLVIPETTGLERLALSKRFADVKPTGLISNKPIALTDPSPAPTLLQTFQPTLPTTPLSLFRVFGKAFVDLGLTEPQLDTFVEANYDWLTDEDQRSLALLLRVDNTATRVGIIVYSSNKLFLSTHHLREPRCKFGTRNTQWIAVPEQCLL